MVARTITGDYKHLLEIIRHVVTTMRHHETSRVEFFSLARDWYPLGAERMFYKDDMGTRINGKNQIQAKYKIHQNQKVLIFFFIFTH